MKTLHALSLVALLSCGAIAGLGFTGCSSSSDPGTTADTGTTDDTAVATDTAPGDTAPKTDTKVPTDSAPLVCDKLPLDSAFKCEAPTAVQKGGPPATVCTEEMLQEYATKCIAADYKVGATCGEFKSAHPECATCVGNWALDASIIPGKVYPDRDKCWYKVLDEACSTSINCMFKCDDAVCSECDTAAGSSPDGTTSEFQACVNRERKKGGTTVPKGACYDIATGAALKCLTDNSDKIDPCFVAELFSPTGSGGHPDVAAMQREAVIFMRGACRDNGDWSKSAYSCSTPPCDAGVTDTGTTDTATTDTATATDTADGG